MSETLKPTPDTFLRYDAPAGIVVFLVALPLCLGIALASGAPLYSGIIAGAMGGMVVSFLSGSQVSVSGPAAGLTVIVAGAIGTLGYEPFLAALVLAGLLQLGMSAARLGVIADYVPNSVIKGMLAAIGIVIILKQIPHALGRDADYEGNFSFFGPSGSNTVTDILDSVFSASAGPVIISLVSFLVLIFWDKLRGRFRLLNPVPAPIIVVALGIALNQILGKVAPHVQVIEPEHMVTLPVASSAREFLEQFTHPAMGSFRDAKVWTVAITLALVGSLETLLALEASDRLDPFRRISPPNRELFAQGVGNTLSGLIGGLPVTSVVIRSSANVYAGARTWMSSFTHGALLFGSTLLIPTVLNLTPLACLATILITVGYKLTSGKLYGSMYRLGHTQFLPFIATVLAIVFTDLLKGVVAGLVIGLLFVIRGNHRAAVTVVQEDNFFLFRFNKDASFVNKSELRTKLRAVPSNSHVIIDGTRALYVDQDIREVVEDFEKLASHRNITVELKRFEPAAETAGAH